MFHICCKPKTRQHFLNIFPVMSGYECRKPIYLHLQHFVFTFFIKFFSFRVKQPVIWRSDLFMLSVSSYKRSQRTIGDVSQPAARCELFTATDCERQALISPYWSAPVSVCVCFPPRGSVTRFTLGSRSARWEVVAL